MPRWSLLMLVLGGAACGGTVGSTPGAVASGAAGTAGVVSPTAGTRGGGVTTGVAGTTGTGNSSGTGGGYSVPTGGTQGAGVTNTSAAYSDIPCAVGAVLQSRCGMCHGQTPAFGAPMSLIHASDFAKRSVDGSQTVAQAVVARINDNNRPMPQPPNPRLTSSENSTLATWAQAGAMAAACTMPGATPTGAGGTSGSISSTDKPDPTDPDVTCYNITARDPTGAKFSVPNQPDLYHCFNWAPPWGSDKVQVVQWKPVIDNTQVIHHWILYNMDSAVSDKTDMNCVGAHPTGQMAAGWAPGGGGSDLPPDVGQGLTGGGFTLEVHYNNSTAGSKPDASGVRMCVTKTLRQHEAGIHWLGTELILLPAGGSASGVCSPKGPMPITILSSTPHMHLQGRHMTTVINRANGTKEMLIDQPFDFNTQIGYKTPAMIMQGDTLTTTCTYGGAAIYGEGTNNEMCYNFVLAYPNGALSSASGSGLRKNGCTGL